MLWQDREGGQSGISIRELRSAASSSKSDDIESGTGFSLGSSEEGIGGGSERRKAGREGGGGE